MNLDRGEIGQRWVHTMSKGRSNAVNGLAQSEGVRQQGFEHRVPPRDALSEEGGSGAVDDAGVLGPLDDVLGCTQMLLMLRLTPPAGRIGEVERKRPANQRQGTGSGGGFRIANHQKLLYRFFNGAQHGADLNPAET